MLKLRLSQPCYRDRPQAYGIPSFSAWRSARRRLYGRKAFVLASGAIGQGTRCVTDRRWGCALHRLQSLRL